MQLHGLGANDRIQIEKLGSREFRICPVTTNLSTAPNVEPSISAANSSERKDTTISRIVRDTRVSQQVKELYDFHCQACGTRLETASGPYAEGAHIRGLGEPHCGPDTMSNILCLCPNHHAQFDLWGFSVDEDLSLIGIDGDLLVKPNHQIDKSHLQYHREEYSRVMGDRKYV